MLTLVGSYRQYSFNIVHENAFTDIFYSTLSCVTGVFNLLPVWIVRFLNSYQIQSQCADILNYCYYSSVCVPRSKEAGLGHSCVL